MTAGNMLRHAASPYLLQHADNPVHWRMWSEDALAEARREGKPILLSVGYAACHWCHVMAHESFEDVETAALMNRLYVNIKVDREERPDLDHLYMSALHAMGEHGGWPLTMFLTPDGLPFWGGTYFPPEPRWGRPAFRQVLAAIRQAFDREPDKVASNAQAFAGALAKMSAARPGDAIGPALLGRVSDHFLSLADPVEGGLNGAPKFPNAPIFRFLWQEYFRKNDTQAKNSVVLMLRRMAQGGIWDHLGGGFARYATDAAWLVPHFEKMLYDNAQLLELLAFVHAAEPDPLFAARAEELVRWLEREMRTPAGFASAQDADSEGEEGKFYVWTADEVDRILGPDGPAFRAAYDVTEDGNWEGRAILNRSHDPTLKDAATEAMLARGRARLFAARARRVPPLTDDKVLADWNGLMIAALVRAAAVFDRPAWRDLAATVFAEVTAALRDEVGRLAHAWRAGRVSAAGLLDDHAAMARAALALHEATGEARYLDHARAWVAAAEAGFADADGSYFTSAADAADVIVRPRTAADSATPAGSGLMAEVLARLWHLTGNPAWRDRARRLISAFGGAGEALGAMSTLLAAADLLEDGAAVVIAGDAADPEANALRRAALAHPDPAVVVLAARPDLPETHPAHGKGPAGGRAAAYVCRGGTCRLPVTAPAALTAALART